MAIWQFECKIIPLKENTHTLSEKKIHLWTGVKEPSYKIDFLQKEESWSKNIIQYGKIDETCIEFFYFNDELEEIICRIDLRSCTKEKILLVVEYVQNIDALFLVEDKIYFPKIETLLGLIKNSKAYRYCNNPIDFICNLADCNE